MEWNDCARPKLGFQGVEVTGRAEGPEGMIFVFEG